jgi:hypothetical protein
MEGEEHSGSDQGSSDLDRAQFVIQFTIKLHFNEVGDRQECLASYLEPSC